MPVSCSLLHHTPLFCTWSPLEVYSRASSRLCFYLAWPMHLSFSLWSIVPRGFPHFPLVALCHHVRRGQLLHFELKGLDFWISYSCSDFRLKSVVPLDLAWSPGRPYQWETYLALVILSLMSFPSRTPPSLQTRFLGSRNGGPSRFLRSRYWWFLKFNLSSFLLHTFSHLFSANPLLIIVIDNFIHIPRLVLLNNIVNEKPYAFQRWRSTGLCLVFFSSEHFFARYLRFGYNV